MRFWYVVGDKEYWLEPDITFTKEGTVRLWGCRLFLPDGSFKGYWTNKCMPLAVLRDLKAQVVAAQKNEEKRARAERAVMNKLRR